MATADTAQAMFGSRTGAEAGRRGAPDPLDDAVRPPLHPSRWRRPYRIGGYRVGAATVLLALCPMLLLGSLLSYLAQSPVRAAVAAGIALVLVVLALRILRMGLYVSTRGVRRVRLLRTTKLRWHQVGELVVYQMPVRVLGTPRRRNGEAVALRRMSGGEPWEEIISSHNADFLSRTRKDDYRDAVAALFDWYRACTDR
ncbi:hypothetical protein BIV57_16485 [Mangrovactinospora gilvigrisea]|uniref:PH domain-containing protein n=1 Tax=Mangrovactinospora gilvigrisea TaxID=1428644 RepID=A0A1J7C497_9ACTN|nr:hypothetical protein [Mangrovactinospora gilvigrisea]OIV36396.1 hypothetical protein BIV57_16485 [Mangrovactinospora gilvigrisea]